MSGLRNFSIEFELRIVLRLDLNNLKLNWNLEIFHRGFNFEQILMKLNLNLNSNLNLIEAELNLSWIDFETVFAFET